MAGEWIKLHTATVNKPEVSALSNLLGVCRRETLGTLIDFWIWVDQNSTDGSVRFLSGLCPTNVQDLARKSLDDLMRCSGFAAAMEVIGWLEIGPDGAVSIPNFDRHNGNSAKNRALDAKRKVRSRSEECPDENRTRPGPEKRREEKISTGVKRPLPQGFAVSERVERWAQENGHSLLAKHLEHFVQVAMARGYKYTDWDSAFMRAVRENWAKVPVKAVLKVSL